MKREMGQDGNEGRDGVKMEMGWDGNEGGDGDGDGKEGRNREGMRTAMGMDGNGEGMGSDGSISAPGRGKAPRSERTPD